MTQGTTGTPIVPGSTTGLSIAEPLEETWLALNTYLKIMGVVSPPHFFGSHNANVFPITGNCDVVVPRYGWQLSDVSSRQDIKEEIAEAERELSEFMGFLLGPRFVKNELHPYPKPYETLAVGSGGLGTNNLEISISAKYGNVLQAGQRGITLIGTATTGGGGLEFLDKSGDGYADTAQVTVATTQTDLCGLKVYVPDTDGEPEWEIRHPRKKYISGGNVVFEFDIWLFINPDVDSRYNTQEQYRAVDYIDTSNLLVSVDIYYETVDNTQSSVRFFWEEPSGYSSGSAYDVGSLRYQDGTLIVRNLAQGEVVPRAATYDSTNGYWVRNQWVYGRDPDQVRISYYAGNLSQGYLKGRSCDPLDMKYAKAIAYMATARLSRSICACDGINKFFDDMREDLARIVPDLSYNVSLRDLDNPFGTRRGEVMAWKLLGKVDRDKQVKAEVAII